MKVTLGILAFAVSTFACALSLSPTWSRQDGLSLSTSRAEARARVYIRTPYAASSAYYTGTDLPWYACGPTISTVPGAAPATATLAGATMPHAPASVAPPGPRSRAATASCIFANRIKSVAPGER